MSVTAVQVLEPLLLRLKALADKKRLRIVAPLARGERCVCELQDTLTAGQSLLSCHLRTLKEAGLVTNRRRPVVDYALDREAIGAVEEFLCEARVAKTISSTTRSRSCEAALRALGVFGGTARRSSPR